MNTQMRNARRVKTMKPRLQFIMDNINNYQVVPFDDCKTRHELIMWEVVNFPNSKDALFTERVKQMAPSRVDDLINEGHRDFSIGCETITLNEVNLTRDESIEYYYLIDDMFGVRRMLEEQRIGGYRLTDDDEEFIEMNMIDYNIVVVVAIPYYQEIDNLPVATAFIRR